MPRTDRRSGRNLQKQYSGPGIGVGFGVGFGVNGLDLLLVIVGIIIVGAILIAAFAAGVVIISIVATLIAFKKRTPRQKAQDSFLYKLREGTYDPGDLSHEEMVELLGRMSLDDRRRFIGTPIAYDRVSMNTIDRYLIPASTAPSIPVETTTLVPGHDS